MARVAIPAALLVLTGCISTRPDPVRRDLMLQEFFTPEAVAELETIPLYYGHLEGFCGFAVGDDLGTRAAGVLLGFGNRRQVVLSPDCDDLALFHEYLHQAQYSGCIDTRQFLERLDWLFSDELYGDIPRRWKALILREYARGPAIVALLYRRGLTRELMAYIIEGWVAGAYDLPDYFLEVYADTVRLERRPKPR